MARIFVPSTVPLLDTTRLKEALVLKPVAAWVSAFLMAGPWQAMMRTIQEILEAVPVVSGSVEVGAQGSAIGTTDVPTPPRRQGTGLNEGLYRVNYYLRTTVPASVSSAFQLTIGWTNGVAITASSAVLNGNTAASVVSGSIVVYADLDTHITYAVSYASVGVPDAQFMLQLSVEELP